MINLNAIIDFSNKIYKMKDIQRFNDSQRLRNEDVSQHSFFVSLLVLELRKYYNFDLTKALVMSINHDLPEIEISDIPHSVKSKFPFIKSSMIEAEKEAAFKLLSKEDYKLHLAFMAGKTPEAKIVLLADTLSCLQYSQSEITLGNSGYISKIYTDIMDRITVCIKDMKKMEVKNARK